MILKILHKKLKMPSFNDLAMDVYNELNEVRTNPGEFARRMESILDQYKSNKAFHRTKTVPLITREGREACEDAIQFLRNAHPLPSLNWAEGLGHAAQFLVNDTGPKGIIGHIASDESRFQERVEWFGKWNEALAEALDYGSVSAFEVVCSFLIDDGLPTRPHRNAIFSNKFKNVGIGAGFHSQYKSMVCIIFSGDFLDRIAENAPSVQDPDGELHDVPEVGEWLDGAVKMTCEVRTSKEDGKTVKRLKKYWEMANGATQITDDVLEVED